MGLQAIGRVYYTYSVLNKPYGPLAWTRPLPLDPANGAAGGAKHGQAAENQVTGSAVASSTTTNDPASDDTARDRARVRRPAEMAHP